MNATEQYFPMQLFIMLYKVVLTFESVDEIIKRDVWCCLFFFNILEKEILFSSILISGPFNPFNSQILLAGLHIFS